jgi:Arc/MetJ-type ribon-helix-helix transcriptional regulator
MKKTPRMKNCTINIPNQYDDIIQKLIKLKIVPSRSEAIRIAIKEFLSREEQIKILFTNIVDTQDGNNSSWSKTTSTKKTTQTIKD